MEIKIEFIEPMLCRAVAKLPEGPAWSYELKFDGYRALGLKTYSEVRLLSRNGKDFGKRFVSIAQALEKLPGETVVDGEIVDYDRQGRPSFNVLQNYRSAGQELHFFLFDLLTLRGKALIQQPLEKRRELLRTKVMPRLPDSIRYSETLEAPAADLVEAVREQGFRGHCRQTARQCLRIRKPIGRVGEGARQSRAGAGNRRLCACIEKL